MKKEQFDQAKNVFIRFSEIILISALTSLTITIVAFFGYAGMTLSNTILKILEIVNLIPTPAYMLVHFTGFAFGSLIPIFTMSAIRSS